VLALPLPRHICRAAQSARHDDQRQLSLGDAVQRLDGFEVRIAEHLGVMHEHGLAAAQLGAGDELEKAGEFLFVVHGRL
jgi:hypothetical protein